MPSMDPMSRILMLVIMPIFPSLLKTLLSLPRPTTLEIKTILKDLSDTGRATRKSPFWSHLKNGLAIAASVVLRTVKAKAGVRFASMLVKTVPRSIVVVGIVGDLIKYVPRHGIETMDLSLLRFNSSYF